MEINIYVFILLCLLSLIAVVMIIGVFLVLAFVDNGGKVIVESSDEDSTDDDVQDIE